MVTLSWILSTIKYFIVVHGIKQKYSPCPEYSESKKKHKISVFIPVLHEEKILEKFLTDLSLQDYPSDLFEIYVITTQKEYLNESIKPNTIDIIRNIIAQNRFSNLRIIQIHYPYDSGFKANQLDFAFKQILKEKGENEVEDTYFLFLDADSEPDSCMIRRFNGSIEDGIEIYQQPLLWFKNIDVITNPLMRSFAFSQSYFSVSYEIPMYTGKFFPWRLKYLVGNGLFLKGSFLSRIGGFPEIIEDVRMGRLTSFLDIPVKIVPWFGIVETAKNFSIYVKQSSVWFFGCGLFVSDYLKAKTLRKNFKSRFQDYILLIYGFFKAFRWMNKGLFHLVGLIFAVLTSSPFLLFLFLISLFVNSVVPVLFVSHDFKNILLSKMTNAERIKITFSAILFAPFLFMINFVGPYYGLLKLIKFYLWGQITLPKTER